MAVPYDPPRFLPCGDTGLCVEFSDRIDRSVNGRVQRLFRRLKSEPVPGIVDLNPTYRSLFIQYHPWQCSYEGLVIRVENALQSLGEDPSPQRDTVRIPVCYGGIHGPDLNEVADFHGMLPADVIRLHTAPVYYVYMIGFTPGFPYLGGLDDRLFTPRKKEPRKRVPAGTVGIADRQTGIYSIDSPGGWQLIGRTPLRLFDTDRSDPFLLVPGDQLQFFPISEDEFEGHSHS